MGVMENADHKSMVVKQGEYLTIQEIAKELTEATDTIKKRLFRLGIKPLSRDALYPISVLETLRNTPPKGRPKKPEAEAAKQAKKPAKSKK
jgi:hypothetical protein